MSLMLVTTSAPHPGLVTLVPVGSTAVLIALLKPGDVVYRLLASRPFVHIGLLSYGLYLYHNPLFSFVEVYFDHLGDGTMIYKLVLIPVVYLISLASLYLIERPPRHGKRLGQAAILALSVAGIGLFAAFGLFIHMQNGFQSQIARYYAERGMPLLVDVPAERRKIEEAERIVGDAALPFACADEGCDRVLLLGDSLSHDAHLALALHGRDAEYRRVYFDDLCMGSVVSVADLERAETCNDKPVSFGTLLRDADLIMISAKWQESTYLDGYALADMIATELDKPVVVSGAAMFSDLSSFSVKAWRRGIVPEDFEAEFYKYQRWDRARTSNKLKELVAANPRLNWIGRDTFFCDTAAQTCALLDPQGAPRIWDNAHLTTRAYPAYAEFVEDQLSHMAASH